MIQVVEQLEPAFERALRGFLIKTPVAAGATPEHDPHWLTVLREGLGHRTFCLIARDDQSNQITGYLPAALVASRLFGRFLVSLPYLNRAGVVASDESTAAELIDAAVKLASGHDVKYLELRHHGRGSDHPKLFVKKADKVRMALALPGAEDARDGDVTHELWERFNPKVRNAIRKAERAKFQVQWGGGELLDEFYDVFAVNMRDLGTPVYPRRLFLCILDTLAPRAELALVTLDGRPVAGALLIHDAAAEGYPATTAVPSASCLRQFNSSNANMWMYHQLLQRAVQRGSREFDFGRSSVDSGTFKFKKQWGARPEPTTWQYHVRHGDVGAMRPTHPRNLRRIQTWQKLPVWLTRLVGPTIVRGIP
jgi:FemAB-related protein (PEP-CTERM system-associated)